MDTRLRELALQAECFEADTGALITDDIDLAKFAELIPYAESKDCERYYLALMRDAVEQAVLSEREACANLCKKIHNDYMNDKTKDGYDWPDGRDCYEAIMARGQS